MIKMANKNAPIMLNTSKANEILNQELILNLEDKDELLGLVRQTIRKKQKRKIDLKTVNSSYRFNL